MQHKIPVKNTPLLRFIATLLPLKYKLNILINKYLQSSCKLVIPYANEYAIVIDPILMANTTVNKLIFEGTKHLPEYHLLQQIKISLTNGFVGVDVGANIGTVIWQLADKCSYMYAFEPMHNLSGMITDTADYNGFKKILVFNKAVGSRLGKVEMINNVNSSVVHNTFAQNKIAVEITTLDAELKDVSKIDFIKIDVEGFELEVLKGAEEVLKIHKPALLVELHPVFLKDYEAAYQDVLAFLEQHHYKISYYSFLREIGENKVNRLLSRYTPNRGQRFATKNEFINDIERLPAKLSYHLYCEYNKV